MILIGSRKFTNQLVKTDFFNIEHNIDHVNQQEFGQENDCKDKEYISSNNINPAVDVGKQESHECCLCDDKFFTKSQLKDHLDRHISSGHYGKMLFNCENCNMELPNKNTLNDHIQVCNEEKDIVHDVYIGHDIEQTAEKDIELIHMGDNDIAHDIEKNIVFLHVSGLCYVFCSVNIVRMYERTWYTCNIALESK